MDGTLTDSKVRNEAKKELYHMFAGKVETDIIDMVLAGCDYDLEKSIDNILSMVVDDSRTEGKVKQHKKQAISNRQEPASSQGNNLPVETSRHVTHAFPEGSRVNGGWNPSMLMSRPNLVPYMPRPMPVNLPFQTRMQWVDQRPFHVQPRVAPNRYGGNAMGKTLILMRGLPGSGKSTLARTLRGTSGVIFSTDNFFEVNGEYNFDPMRLGEAHKWNQFRAKRAMEDGRSPVIIDNTNIQLWEMKPYVSRALMFGYQVKFVEPITPWAWNPKELARRNSHGVQRESIERMLDRYERNASVDRILGALSPEKRDRSDAEPAGSKGEIQQTRHHHSDTDLHERSRIFPTETDRGRSPAHRYSSRSDAQREADNYWNERQQLSTGSGSHGRRSPKPYDSFVSRGSDRNTLEAKVDMITIDHDDETDRGQPLPQRVGRRGKNERNYNQGRTLENEQGTVVIDVTQTDTDDSMDGNIDDIIDEIDLKNARVTENQTTWPDPNGTVENRQFSLISTLRVDSLSKGQKVSKQNGGKSSEHGSDTTGSNDDVLKKDRVSSEAYEKMKLLITSDRHTAMNKDNKNENKATSSSDMIDTEEELFTSRKESKIDDSFKVDNTSHIAPLKNPILNLRSGLYGSKTETTDSNKKDDKEESDNRVEMGLISSSSSNKGVMIEEFGDLTTSSAMDVAENFYLTTATVTKEQSVVHSHEPVNFEPRMVDSSLPEVAVFESLGSSRFPVFVHDSSAQIAFKSKWTNNLDAPLVNNVEAHGGIISDSSPGTGLDITLSRNPASRKEASIEPFEVSSGGSEAASQLTGAGDAPVSVNDDSLDLDGDLRFLYECFSDVSKERIKQEFIKSGRDVTKTCDALLETDTIFISDDEDMEFDESMEEEESLSTINVCSDATPSSLALTDPAILRYSNAYEVASPLADTSLEVLSPLRRSSTPVKSAEGGDECFQLTRESVADIGNAADVLLQDATLTSTSVLATEERKWHRDGELFVCEKEESESVSDGLHVALDYRLGKVLKERYGAEDSFNVDELNPDDFIVFLEKKFCQKLYRKWNHARETRKRKLQEIVKLDEEYAKKLQFEEESTKQQLACEIDGAANSKPGPTSPIHVSKRKRATVAAVDVPSPVPALDTQPWTEVVAGGKGIDESEKLQRRLHLHQLFSGVETKALDDVLAANNYNLNVTVNLVRASFEMLAHSSVASMNNAATTRKQTSTDVAKNASPFVVGKPSPNAKDASGMYQTFTEPTYHDFRAEAQMHANLRAEYFRKAAKAHGEKQGQLAAYYAQLGRDHNDKMKEAHSRAAALILESKNENHDRQSVLDLHGLHVEEALEAMEGFLYEAEHKSKQLHVEIITGRGNHSKGGIARLKPIVMNRLIKLNYRFEPINQGSLRVWLR